jgi:TM2 domain-containing membrane protein YozV
MKDNLILFLICLFFGWFGIDKLYKGDVKLFIIKLVLNLFLIGEIWNIYDIVCAALGKYKLNPLK